MRVLVSGEVWVCRDLENISCNLHQSTSASFPEVRGCHLQKGEKHSRAWYWKVCLQQTQPHFRSQGLSNLKYGQVWKWLLHQGYIFQSQFVFYHFISGATGRYFDLEIIKEFPTFEIISENHIVPPGKRGYAVFQASFSDAWTGTFALLCFLCFRKAARMIIMSIGENDQNYILKHKVVLLKGNLNVFDFSRTSCIHRISLPDRNY